MAIVVCSRCGGEMGHHQQDECEFCGYVLSWNHEDEDEE